MTKIGVGVTSTPSRALHLELFLQQLDLCTRLDENVVLHVSANNSGIANGKNDCLRTLMAAGCTDLFLFDDDCFPIAEGWAEVFIKYRKYNGHLMYLRSTPTIYSVYSRQVDLPGLFSEHTIVEYSNCSGCMMYLTREVVEKVGAFDEQFGFYGFEHADYSNRVHMAGLTPYGKYACPADAGKYIHSLDLDGVPDWALQVIGEHKPSMPFEFVQKGLEISAKHYSEIPKQIYLPL